VTAVGFLGDDPQADSLLSLWPSEVNAENVFRAGEFKTTCKSRILAGSVHSFRQQVVRLDREHLLALEPEHESRLSDALQTRIPGVTGIIISDYSLGNVTLKLRDLIIQLGKKYSIPVVVDSRDDPTGFPGATTVTPNITEVETVTGRRLDFDSQEIETVCSSARVKWDLEALLVTRGKHGISLFLKDRTVHIPAFGEEDVVDVTGAGDTVAAAYTSSLGAGASFEEAARIANYAGGLVVMKKGTATITPEELITAIRKGAES
jgi:rfaE bifunctional protein kinase chain/domain